MNVGSIGRRDFLIGATTGLAFGYYRLAKGDPWVAMPTMIEWPFNGAVLNHRHGVQASEGLEIVVRGLAPFSDRVSVNGQPAERSGHRFSAKVRLKNQVEEIVAISEGYSGRQEHRIRVLWDRNSIPRYRFAIDDNGFFLRDIAQKQYQSLFDCFYLEMLRKFHQKYGTKFVLNIYYTTGDGFTLRDFPDRYRGEWADNADWLKLAFHAYADKPDRPYQYAPPEKVIADLELVQEQILRFAGEATYCPTTIIHWGMVLPATLPALARKGIRVLSGYFRKLQGVWDVNYHLDPVRCEYLAGHDALMDFDTGIVFSKIDIVCNTVPPDNVIPTLQPLAEDPNTAEIMDLMTHEQYFWPFYDHYLPDHAERLDVALRWVTEKGYKPVFFHEGFLGVPGDPIGSPQAK